MITSELSRAWDDYRYGQPSPVLDAEFPFINLLAPELPAPGISFINQAIALGDPAPTVVKDGKFRYLTSHGPVLAYLVRRALYDTQFTLPVQVKRQVVQAPFVPGHVIGDDPRDMDGGPRPARVLLLGKNPGREEAQNQRNLSGPSADIVFQALRDLGIPDTEYADFYVTNLVKWPQLNPQSSTLEQAQIRDTEVLLWQELRLVKPDFILCLGSDASKYLLGTGCGVNSMAGRVESLQIPDYVAGQEPTYHTAKVMAVTNPAAVFRSPEVYPEFRLHLSEFFSLVRGEDIGRKRGKTDYRCVYTQEELRRIVDEIRNDPDPARRIIAIDGEWHGNHPSDANAYLRTIQFSSKAGEGICVVLRYQGGSSAFRPTVASAIDELKRLCCKDVAAGWLPRVGGHFLRADLPWLIQEGLDARDAYAPAESPEACRTDGGWDTSLVHHAVNEVGGFRLTDLVLRLTRLPVYDTGLKAAIIDYCKQTGLDREDLEGFGFLPAWVLHPTDTDPEREEAYAQMDADATRQIFMEHIKPGGLLDRDMYGNSSWEPYWRSHKASLGVLEMEMTGLVVDRERVDALSTLFEQARDSLLADLRQKINWPTFNAKSYQQCVAWIFGDSYLGKTWLPEDVDCLELEPIVTTGKPSKVWADVIVKGEQAKYSPSVAKEVLGILGHQHPLVMQLRDIKFLEQVLKRNTLPPPIKDKNGKYKQREDGSKIYKNGLGSVAARDGRVHTRLSQVKETGRAASSDPNLQAISKRREADYSRILGHWGTNKETGEKEYAGSYPDVFPSPLYQMPIRTVLRASPGCVLIETDYTGAELAMIAWLSRDPLMIEHVRRNALRDNDPDYYEMHSQMAVRAFQLRCEPTKRGLAEAGRSDLRLAAKCVIAGSRLHTTAGWLPAEQIVGELADDQWESLPGACGLANDGKGVTPLVGRYCGGLKPCVTVETEFGYKLTSTQTHQYRVIDTAGRYGWRAAGELKPGDWVCIRRAVGPFGNNVAFPTFDHGRNRTSFKSINFPDQFNEDWAAFCGLFVSEGAANEKTGAVQVSISDTVCPEFFSKVQNLLRRLFGDRLQEAGKEGRSYLFRVTSVELASWLCKYFGYDCESKSLPGFIFQWPQALLQVFLSWLFEGDGSSKPNGSTFTINYSSKSERLIDDLLVLLSGFGVICRKGVESRKKYPGERYFVITVRGNKSKDAFLQGIGFVTQRKQQKCVTSGGYSLDRDVIPNQEAKLRLIMPYIPGRLREKCRECVRLRARVQLSPSRLRVILAAFQAKKASQVVLAAYEELQQIAARGISYQRVAAVQDAGKHRVYDVTTTGEHVVAYNAILTHQSVAFGIPYGRQAAAIARQCREEGVNVDTEQCQQIIDFYFSQYPRVGDFLQECRHGAVEVGWICGPFGRFRRFYSSDDRSVVGEQERQAQNFPIQNGVADAVWQAVANFYEFRSLCPSIVYRLVLQIHDALLFEVPYAHVVPFVQHVLPACMIDGVPVYPRKVNGSAITVDSPHYFATETDIMINWGEKLKAAALTALGICPEKLAESRANVAGL